MPNKNVELLKKEQNLADTHTNIPKKKMIVRILIVVMLVLLGVGIGVYITPVNRLNRQVELGKKCLLELRYEQAKAYFDKAIEIDEQCMEAYMGGLEARMKGASTETENFFEEIQSQIERMDSDTQQENMQYILEVYEKSPEIYTDDKKLSSVLVRGVLLSGQDVSICRELEACYLRLAEAAETNEMYVEALNYYKKALSLQYKEEIFSKRNQCLMKYIDQLMENKQFEYLRGLLAEYKEGMDPVELQRITKEVDEAEALLDKQNSFMKKIYEYMRSGNYEAMCEIDGSDEASEFMKNMQEKNFYYSEQEESNNTKYAAGLCLENNGGYYFYLGDVMDNQKEGSGVSFVSFSSSAYCIYSGEWKQDAPNGKGTMVYISDDTKREYSGMLVDGLWDGHVSATVEVYWQEYTYDLSFDADEGIPINIEQRLYDEGIFREERVAIVNNEFGSFDVGERALGPDDIDMDESKYVYAWNYNETPKPDWDDEWYWPFPYPYMYSASDGKTTVGIFGFSDSL